MYRYLWHALYRGWKDRIPFAVHAVPAILAFLVYAGLYLALGRLGFAAVAQDVFAGNAPAYVVAIEASKVIHGTVYAFFVLRLLRNNLQALRQWASRDERKQWLQALVVAFAIAWITVLITGIFLWTNILPETPTRWLTALQLLVFLAFFYMVTFFALRYPAVLSPKEVREEIRKKLNLPQDFVEETLRRLKDAEKRKFYRNTEVTLSSLAEELGLHPNALSYIVNETIGRGFREYLNNLRIDEFLRLADNGKDSDSQSNYLEMAFDSGFASKSPFLRAFRQRFSTTPADYLQTLTTNSHT